MELQILNTSDQMVLLEAPHCLLREVIPVWTAERVLDGDVRVLDCGNGFDVFGIARELRRRGANPETLLRRIYVSRAFTCYQVATMLMDSVTFRAPILVMDLLSTFCDENVRQPERLRLLNDSIHALLELERDNRVLVTVSWRSIPEERVFLERLEDAAGHVTRLEPEPSPEAAPRLF